MRHRLVTLAADHGAKHSFALLRFSAEKLKMAAICTNSVLHSISVGRLNHVDVFPDLCLHFINYPHYKTGKFSWFLLEICRKTVLLSLHYCPNIAVPINVNFFLLQYVGTSVENICMTSLGVRYFSTSSWFFFEETGSRQTTWNIHCLQFGMYPIFLAYYFSLSTCLWPTQEYLVSASISS